MQQKLLFSPIGMQSSDPDSVLLFIIYFQSVCCCEIIFKNKLDFYVNYTKYHILEHVVTLLENHGSTHKTSKGSIYDVKS
jgi:hypothetical protein